MTRSFPSDWVRAARLGAGATAVVLLAVLVAGCNLLAPSEPERPSTAEETISVTPDFSSPEAVLATIVDAVAARNRPGNGRAAYMEAYADPADGLTFTMTFDPEVVDERRAANKTIPTWTRELEEDFYIYLSRLAGNHDLVLTWRDWEGSPDDIQDLSAGTATIYTGYSVAFIEDDGVTETPLGLGRATLEMRRLASGQWVITSWTDSIDPASGGPDPSNPGQRSFSRLRIDSTEFR